MKRKRQIIVADLTAVIAGKIFLNQSPALGNTKRLKLLRRWVRARLATFSRQKFWASFWVWRSFVQFLGSFSKKSSQKLWWEKTFLRNDLELSVGLWSLNVYSSTPHPRPPTPKKLFVWIPAEKVTNTFLGLLLDSTAEILIFLRNLTLPWWKWCNWNILNASEVRGEYFNRGTRQKYLE